MKPARAMRAADAAIAGRLLRVIPRGRLKADYRFRVQHVYKRGRGLRRGRVVSVRSARQSSACGLPRRVGRRYGLLLRRYKGRWTSGLCGVLKPRQLGSAARSYNCAS